jgi:hypothetical protein
MRWKRSKRPGGDTLRKIIGLALCWLFVAGCSYLNARPVASQSAVIPDATKPAPLKAAQTLPILMPAKASDTPAPMPLKTSDTPRAVFVKSSDTPTQFLETRFVDLSGSATAQVVPGMVTTSSVRTPIARTEAVTPQASYPVQGKVLLQDGMCCVGGVVGTQTLMSIAFSAQSPSGTVTEMRFRLSTMCMAEADLAQVAWQPFVPDVTLPLKISAINWIGYWVSVQYRDGQGNLSPVYCDDISVEGMPPPPPQATF